MRNIGLHIRFKKNINEAAEEAKKFGIPIFQTFFIEGDTGEFIKLTDHDIRHFNAYWRPQFAQLYVHATHWVHLASVKATHSFPLLKHQLHMARKLSFDYLVLHPGSGEGHSKMKAIDILASSLNKAFDEAGDVKILLENSAHGGEIIGGDPHELRLILEKVNQPDKLGFCIDTAHAFAYGFNIADEKDQDAYISLLDQTIGLKKIALIHLNDTDNPCGSRSDSPHVPPGEGLIGTKSLKRFIAYSAFAKLPVILELPAGLSKRKEAAVLKKVKSW